MSLFLKKNLSSCLCFCLVSVCCPCMAINRSVQYCVLLPDIILLTQYYYHRGTRLNAMRRFCLVCMCVVIPFILDVGLVDTSAGVTQDFSTFLLRCLPWFLSREGFSRPFPSSTVRSFFFFVYPWITGTVIVLHYLLGTTFQFLIYFLWGKIPVPT